jgi:hypothetical protein
MPDDCSKLADKSQKANHPIFYKKLRPGLLTSNMELRSMNLSETEKQVAARTQ